jgi:hypothetical protein
MSNRRKQPRPTGRVYAVSPERNKRDIRMRAAVDSGNLSFTAKAQHTKAPALLGRLQKIWDGFRQSVDYAASTQQGSGAASPAAYGYELFSLRYERRAVIDETNQMYMDDIPAHKAIDMYVREAVRKGVLIVVNNGDRCSRKIQRLAQDICGGIEKIINNKDDGSPKVLSWGTFALVEGDTFLQIIVDMEAREVVDVQRMPAAAMERNTDDMDKFIDVAHAYSNVDVMTNSEIATFPEPLIWHGRWNHRDGEKYGQSELTAPRRTRRLLEMVIEATARQAVFRGQMHRLWNIGTEEKPGTKEAVNEFKENNGPTEGLIEQWDPVNAGMEFYGNGLISCEVLEGDGNIEKVVAFLDWLMDYYTSGLPTPRSLYGLQSKNVNRDVLEQQYEQWLLSTETLNDFLEGAVRHIVELALLLKGIDPDIIDFDVHFSESSIEKPNDIIDRALKMFNNGHGAGNAFVWMPLITWERCIQMISDFADVDDVEAEQLAIQRMMADTVNGPSMQMNMMRGKALGSGMPTMMTMKESLANGNGHKNGNGKSTDDWSSTKGVQAGSNGVYQNNVKTAAGGYAGVGQLASPWNSTYGEPQEQPGNGE